jgi:outer membrane immunogenic protein
MKKYIGQTVESLRRPFAASLLLAVLPVTATYADSGFYLGGSVGNATTEFDSDDVEFDEDDFAWKGYGGFNFDVIVVDLAVEAGYVNFGSPGGSVNIPGVGEVGADADVDALTGFGLVGLELGPIGVFAKAGVVSWDAEASVDAIGELDESGTDPAYGVGARFSLGSVELRAEYEMFDIDIDGTDSSDLSMLSAGLVWTF